MSKLNLEGYEPLPTDDDPLAGFPPLMTPKQVAAAGIKTVNTLMSDRYQGVGLPFIKVGRSIRYRKSDVVNYIEAHVFNSTREARVR